MPMNTRALAQRFAGTRLGGFCLLLLAFSASTAQQRPRITGFFTDMHYIEQSGDVLGTEVWIVYGGGEEYYAAVQMAEGSPTPPMVVPVQVSGSRVRFMTRQPLRDHDGKPAPDLVTQFDGTITRDGLSLSINNSQPHLLNRRASYWQ